PGELSRVHAQGNLRLDLECRTAQAHRGTGRCRPDLKAEGSLSLEHRWVANRGPLALNDDSEWHFYTVRQPVRARRQPRELGAHRTKPGQGRNCRPQEVARKRPEPAQRIDGGPRQRGEEVGVDGWPSIAPCEDRAFRCRNPAGGRSQLEELPEVRGGETLPKMVD